MALSRELKSAFSSWERTCEAVPKPLDSSADPRLDLGEGCDLLHVSLPLGRNARASQQLQTLLLPESYRHRNREDQRGPATAALAKSTDISLKKTSNLRLRCIFNQQSEGKRKTLSSGTQLWRIEKSSS